MVWCGRYISLILQEIQGSNLLRRRYLDTVKRVLAVKEVKFLSRADAFSLCLIVAYSSLIVGLTSSPFDSRLIVGSRRDLGLIACLLELAQVVIAGYG